MIIDLKSLLYSYSPNSLRKEEPEYNTTLKEKLLYYSKYILFIPAMMFLLTFVTTNEADKMGTKKSQFIKFETFRNKAYNLTEESLDRVLPITFYTKFDKSTIDQTLQCYLNQNENACYHNAKTICLKKNLDKKSYDMTKCMI